MAHPGGAGSCWRPVRTSGRSCSPTTTGRGSCSPARPRAYSDRYGVAARRAGGRLHHQRQRLRRASDLADGRDRARWPLVDVRRPATAVVDTAARRSPAGSRSSRPRLGDDGASDAGRRSRTVTTDACYLVSGGWNPRRTCGARPGARLRYDEALAALRARRASVRRSRGVRRQAGSATCGRVGRAAAAGSPADPPRTTTGRRISSTSSATRPSPTSRGRSAPACARSSTSSATPRSAPAADQGRTSGVNALGVAAELLGSADVGEVGRPPSGRPYAPVTFAPARRARSRATCSTRSARPRSTPGTRRTAPCSRMSASGSGPGTSRRPARTMHAAVAARVPRGPRGRRRAWTPRRWARSTSQGPDAGEFLDRIYTNALRRAGGRAGAATG